MNRPDAWFDGDGGLVVESSATTRCRRYLWYTAVGEAQSDPLDRSLPTNDETVEALLPAVLQQMRTAGWPISDAGPVSCQVGRLLATSGRPAALCRMALPGGGGQMQLFDKEGEGESDEMVLEVGAAGSTAEIIRRAALNTLGTFGAARPVVIAKVDPASFAWEAETIPLYSVDALVKDSLARLEGLGAYVTRDEARTAMDYWIREVHWQERRVPDSRTEDRADYRIEEDDSVDGYKLGWIRVVECADWKCRKAGTVQGAEG